MDVRETGQHEIIHRWQVQGRGGVRGPRSVTVWRTLSCTEQCAEIRNRLEWQHPTTRLEVPVEQC